MKNCPYCAEEIQDRAVVCKHCKRQLSGANLTVPRPPSNPALHDGSGVPRDRTLRVLGTVVLLVASLWLWYLTIPGVAAWYLWRKAKFTTRTKIIATVSVFILFAVIKGASAYPNRTPALTVVEPQDGYSAQAATVAVRGKVSPAKAVVTVGGRAAPVDGGGNFSAEASLPNESNAVVVTATNGGHETRRTLSIGRTFTTEELAARAQAEAEARARAAAAEEARKARAAADAAARAREAAAYAATPAGKLCRAHPVWTKEECERVADGMIWIGMTLDMLKAERGNPSHANPSNYGRGTSWQWCWSGYTPSCFYGEDDGVITSYN